MTAERPSPDVLEEWIARSWDQRPPFTYECLIEMWQAEQESRAKAHETDYRSKQLDELGRRVAAIERLLGPGCKRLIGDMAKGFGEALAKARVAERERLLAEVEARGYLSHKGIWDSGQAYPAGAVVTDHGSVWCAVTRCEAGERPSRAPGWRLMAKGDAGKAPVVA
jgi:hypothetical protein